MQHVKLGATAGPD